MAGGANFGSFGANLATALTGQILTKRQTEAAKKEKELQLLFPIAVQHMIDTGDGSLAERLISEFDSDMAARLKKDSPFGQLAPLLAGQRREGEMGKVLSPPTLGAPQAGQQATGMFGLPQPQAEPAPPAGLATPAAEAPPPGSPAPLQAGPQLVSPTVQAPVPTQDATSSFFGSPMLTPTQRAERAAQATVATDKLQIEARRKIATELGMSPDAAVDYALYGTRPPQAAQRASAEPYQAVQGETPDGTKMSAVFDQTQGLYVEPISKKPIPGFRPISSTSTTGGSTEFERFLPAYAKDIGKKPEDLTAQDKLDARKKWEQASSTAAATADKSTDAKALAVMAAKNPAMLQGLTPTIIGGVLGEIAKDPELRRTYDQTRMAPVRTQTQQILKTLDDLIITKDAKGNPLPDTQIALTPGAQTLYGKSKLFGTAGWIPGSAAAVAQSALDQVTGQQILDILGGLKAQSRTGATGFGQLNIRELDIIQAAATRLKGGLDEATALRLLKDVRERFAKILLPSDAESGPLNSTGASNAGRPTTITLDTPVFMGQGGAPTNARPGAP